MPTVYDVLQCAFECTVKDGGEQSVGFGLVVGLSLGDGGCWGLEVVEPALFVVVGDRP